MKREELKQRMLELVGPWIESPPRLFRKLFMRGVFRIVDPCERKRVYLTFDDGPIPECTPWILDTLEEFGVKATFFMVGDNVRKYPELYADIKRRGHGLGNHTMHHLNGAVNKIKHYVEDVYEAGTYIESDLFRPPRGWLRSSQKLILANDFRIVMYDVVTRDYSRYTTATDVERNVRRYVRDGSIIVFHDSLKSVNKLKEALPRCLRWLSGEGYEFCIIPGKEMNINSVK